MNLTNADADRKFITVDKDECGHDKGCILQVETQQNYTAFHCFYNIYITFMMVFNLHLGKTNMHAKYSTCIGQYNCTSTKLYVNLT
jgi:hypothetical protein